MRIERVEEAPPEGRRQQRDRSRVDVGGVDFGGASADLTARMQRRLAEAAGAFDAERFADAERLLASIDRLVPGVAEVHELRGLTFYRLGRWAKALHELEQFAKITGSVEQHPVRADCCRALKRWQDADELWAELRDASPSSALVEEGRIVHAGGLADRGRIGDAIRLLERAPQQKRPTIHHLRRWYVLADLYERNGDLPRARRIFTEILEQEPELGDVAERLASLG